MIQYAFHHVIKTGGSTRAHHLREQLGEQFWDCEKQGYRSPPEHVRVIMGHKLPFYKDSARRIVFLRNPASWLVSIYHHDAARGGPTASASFVEWYERGGIDTVNRAGGRFNRMCEWITRMFQVHPLQLVRDAWFVGVTEHMDGDFAQLCRVFGLQDHGWQNWRVAGEWDPEDQKHIPRRYVLTPEMAARIVQENPADVVLYQTALAREDECRAHLTELLRERY